MADIYAARETDTLGISSAMLADAIKAKGVDALYLPTFDAIESYILEHCVPGDLVITMGAGNVVRIADDLIEKTNH